MELKWNRNPFFASTPAKHVPTLLELMKIESIGDLDDLKPPSSGVKKKINAFAVLTPKLAEACQGTDMSTADILIAMVETLRVMEMNVEAGSKEVETIDLEEEVEPEEVDRDEEGDPERIP